MEMRNITVQRPTFMQTSAKKQNLRTDRFNELIEAVNEEYQSSESIEEMRAREKQENEARRAAEQERRRKEQQAKEQAKQNELQMLTQELENARDQADAVGDSFEVYSKCLTIASRISRGDSVPLKDMKYLAEHEPDMFKQAILLRVPNDHPKKHKSVLEDEDEEQTESTSGSETGTAGVSQPDASEAEMPEEIAAEE